MSYNDKPPASFPGLVILVAIAALIVAFLSVRQPMQITRVWIPGVSAGAETPHEGAKAKCASTCRSLDPA